MLLKSIVLDLLMATALVVAKPTEPSKANCSAQAASIKSIESVVKRPEFFCERWLSR